jgi:protein translocase SecG subunit
MTHTILLVSQLVSAGLLALLILVQEKGSGLGEAIGGVGANYQTTKRGAEKFLANATVIMLTLFIALSLALNFA